MKRILSVLLTLIVIISLLPPAAVFANDAEPLYGDCNGDGSVDGKDLVRLRKYLDNLDDETGVSSETVTAGADCNGDGVINGKDLVRLRKYLDNLDDETGTSSVTLGPEKPAIPGDPEKPDDPDDYFLYSPFGEGYMIKANPDYKLPDDVVIPAEHNGRPITGIAAKAFQNLGIKSAFIPRSVYEIDEYAFVGNDTTLEAVYFEDPSDWIVILGYASSEKRPAKAISDPGTAAYFLKYYAEKWIRHTHHSWTVWSTKEQPTCVLPGYKQRYCTVCGETESEEIPALGHDFKDYVCRRCGYDITETIFMFSERDDGTYAVAAVNTEKLPESIVIPSEHLGKPVTAIRMMGFTKSECLKCVTVPDSVTLIDKYAFSGCSNLEKINLPDGVVEIAASAFAQCVSLESITIPDSVTAIGSGAFSGCVNLKNVKLPAGITETGNAAFAGCTRLESITVPHGVVSVSERTFDGCAALTQAVLPDGLQTIGAKAFAGCTSLNRIYIPDGVVTVGGEAFSGCAAMTAVDIPASLETVGRGAFDGCAGLTGVYITDIGKWCGVDFMGGYSANPLYYAENLYLNKVKVENAVIPEGTENINVAAFYNCKSLKTVVIPEGVASIGDHAFEECKNLTGAVIPDSVKSIGSFAFSGCYGMKNCTLGGGVESIGIKAFERCWSLTEIDLPQSLKSIDTWAFYDCRRLKAVNVPAGVSYIGNMVFVHCGSIESIEVGAGNEKYHSSGNCLIETESGILKAGCKNSVIPDDGSVTVIGDGAFLGCGSLVSINIPVSVVKIGDNGLAFCSVLKDIYYGGTVSQWEAVIKGAYWDSASGDYTVHCTDGTVNKT